MDSDSDTPYSLQPRPQVQPSLLPNIPASAATTAPTTAQTRLAAPGTKEAHAIASTAGSISVPSQESIDNDKEAPSSSSPPSSPVSLSSTRQSLQPAIQPDSEDSTDVSTLPPPLSPQETALALATSLAQTAHHQLFSPEAGPFPKAAAAIAVTAIAFRLATVRNLVLLFVGLGSMVAGGLGVAFYLLSASDIQERHRRSTRIAGFGKQLANGLPMDEATSQWLYSGLGPGKDEDHPPERSGGAEESNDAEEKKTSSNNTTPAGTFAKRQPNPTTVDISPEIDPAVEQMITYAIRDFVNVPMGLVEKDQHNSPLRGSMVAIAMNFTKKLRNMRLPETALLAVFGLQNNFIVHLRAYRELRASGLPIDLYVSKHANADSVLGRCYHQEERLKQFRSTAKAICQSLLAKDDQESASLFAIMQEIMATFILQSSIENACDPDRINLAIIDYFKAPEIEASKPTATSKPSIQSATPSTPGQPPQQQQPEAISTLADSILMNAASLLHKAPVDSAGRPIPTPNTPNIPSTPSTPARSATLGMTSPSPVQSGSVSKNPTTPRADSSLAAGRRSFSSAEQHNPSQARPIHSSTFHGSTTMASPRPLPLPQHHQQPLPQRPQQPPSPPFALPPISLYNVLKDRDQHIQAFQDFMGHVEAQGGMDLVQFWLMVDMFDRQVAMGDLVEVDDFDRETNNLWMTFCAPQNPIRVVEGLQSAKGGNVVKRMEHEMKQRLPTCFKPGQEWALDMINLKYWIPFTQKMNLKQTNSVEPTATVVAKERQATMGSPAPTSVSMGTNGSLLSPAPVSSSNTVATVSTSSASFDHLSELSAGPIQPIVGANTPLSSASLPSLPATPVQRPQQQNDHHQQQQQQHQQQQQRQSYHQESAMDFGRISTSTAMSSDSPTTPLSGAPIARPLSHISEPLVQSPISPSVPPSEPLIGAVATTPKKSWPKIESIYVSDMGNRRPKTLLSNADLSYMLEIQSVGGEQGWMLSRTFQQLEQLQQSLIQQFPTIVHRIVFPRWRLQPSDKVCTGLELFLKTLLLHSEVTNSQRFGWFMSKEFDQAENGIMPREYMEERELAALVEAEEMNSSPTSGGAGSQLFALSGFVDSVMTRKPSTTSLNSNNGGATVHHNNSNNPGSTAGSNTPASVSVATPAGIGAAAGRQTSETALKVGAFFKSFSGIGTSNNNNNNNSNNNSSNTANVSSPTVSPLTTTRGSEDFQGGANSHSRAGSLRRNPSNDSIRSIASIRSLQPVNEQHQTSNIASTPYQHQQQHQQQQQQQQEPLRPLIGSSTPAVAAATLPEEPVTPTLLSKSLNLGSAQDQQQQQRQHHGQAPHNDLGKENYNSHQYRVGEASRSMEAVQPTLPRSSLHHHHHHPEEIAAPTEVASTPFATPVPLSIAETTPPPLPQSPPSPPPVVTIPVRPPVQLLSSDELDLLIETSFTVLEDMLDFSKGQSIRRMTFGMLRELVRKSYRVAINQSFSDWVDQNTNHTKAVEMVQWIKDDMMWPGGQYATSPEVVEKRTEAEKLKTRQEASELFKTMMPGSLVTVLGKEAVVKGLVDVFEMMQIKELNMGLALSVFEMAVRLILTR